MKFLILPLFLIFSQAHGACIDVWKTDLQSNLKKLNPALRADLPDDSTDLNVGSSIGTLLQHSDILPKVKFEKNFIQLLSGLAAAEEKANLYADYNVDSGVLGLRPFLEKLDALMKDPEIFCFFDAELDTVRPMTQKEVFQLFSRPR